MILPFANAFCQQYLRRFFVKSAKFAIQRQNIVKNTQYPAKTKNIIIIGNKRGYYSADAKKTQVICE